jgi:glycosyltransferase involved in cell wall biosynthesis
VADATPFILAADALILPSDDPEPFGLVLIEAFALGRPVVASRAGGPVDIVSEGEDGWLYDIRDQSQLATLLSRLTLADLRAAGRRAQQTYEERFSPERYQANLREFVRAELHVVP